MNFIYFYQSLNKVDLIGKKLLITFINNIFIICEKRYIFIIFKFNNECDRLFNNYDLIEVLNLIDFSLLKNLLDLLSCKYILDFKSIKLYAEDNIYRLYFL